MSVIPPLASTTFGASLPSNAISSLGRLFREQPVPAGATIFREGDEVDVLSVIAAGEVALEMDVPGRGRLRILSLAAGDVLGWSPLLGSQSMSATATALQDSVLYIASASELRAVCKSDRELGFYLMREIACSLGKRLLATRLQMLDLFCHDTAEL